MEMSGICDVGGARQVMEVTGESGRVLGSQVIRLSRRLQRRHLAGSRERRPALAHWNCRAVRILRLDTLARRAGRPPDCRRDPSTGLRAGCRRYGCGLTCNLSVEKLQSQLQFLLVDGHPASAAPSPYKTPKLLLSHATHRRELLMFARIALAAVLVSTTILPAQQARNRPRPT